MALTTEQLSALYAPFPLEWHTLREGYKLWKAEDADIRWFVYVDWWAVHSRLEDVFPGGWSMPEPKIIALAKSVLAIVGITINGETRWYNGGQDDSGADDGKGALTDGLRRAAAQWGVAKYVYSTVLTIKTKSYQVKGSDGKWKADYKLKEQRELEAFKQFERWYKKEFATSAQPSPTPQPSQPATTPAVNEKAKTALGEATTIDHSTGSIISAERVEPDYAALEVAERRKAVTALDNEAVTIYKVTYNATHNGMGAPSWTALAHDANGTSLPITVGERGAALVKKAGWDWPTTDGDGLAIDVITEVVDGKRRIKNVQAIDGSWQAETPKTAEKPASEAKTTTSSYVPDWTVIYSKVKSLYDNPKHMGNSVQALYREGAFADCRNDADAINIVIQHKNGFAEGKTG